MTQHFIDAFIATAQKYPHHTAVEEPQGITTYDLLLRRAAGIGMQLMAQKLPAESVIGIAIEKSADYIAAILGVWYAGLAFAPLPPSLPAARRDLIVADADIRLFLTTENLPPPIKGGKIPLPAGTRDSDLAYVMHTSGSTGKPKGVLVEQRGICNVLMAQIDAFKMTPASRSLFYLSTSFDASLSDIGAALLSGAALIITDDATLKDGEKLTRFLARARITHCDMPPSLLRILQPEDMPQSLGCIIIGGETSPPDAVRRWARHMNVVNVYGPTETTICTSLCRCDPYDWTRPLLGVPFDGVDYRIIEDELYIGGCQIARGYLNLPDLTTRKFVTIGGKRLYRTGDRVRRLENGDIEYMGRIDRQFKLRGQLVEPDEIETQLQACGGIRKAAVIKTAEPAQVIAYITSDQPVLETALKSHLATQLPAWMVPAHIVRLDMLPLTVTGKTDYAALSALPVLRICGAAAPQTASEKAQWQLWRGVIGHDSFGIDQSFYSAGGDSLGIIRLTLDAARRGIDARPADVAEGKTIREIAAGTAAGEAACISAHDLRQIAKPDTKKIAAARTRAAAADMETTPVLLTGATGCLGSRVLHGLLTAEGTEDIYCIVRADSDAAAQARILKTFAKNNLHISPAQATRLKSICGDVSQHQCGLSDNIYKSLTMMIGRIYHCAATVNMLADFESLAPANFDAVRHMLDFALAGRRKDLHAASTLSVFVSTDQNTGILREDDALQNVRRVYGGYAQTKFAAECLLLQVPADACRIWHYRFGLLTGDTKSGAAPERDFLALFGRGLAALGAVPDGFDDQLHVDITPVDYAARAMLHLAAHAPADTYHIANPRPLSLGHFMAAMARTGRPLSRLAPADWKEMLQTRPMDTAESAAALGLCRALGTEDYARHRIMDLFQATDITFDMTRADRYLQPAGIICPAADDALLDLYMRSIFPRRDSPLRVCLFGPESTGKSTLAAKLAAHYQAAFCTEYAKEYLAAQKGKIAAQDIPAIAAGQRRSEMTAQESATDILICDTDLLTTQIWSNWLFDACPAWVSALGDAAAYDIYLLMDIDTPWVKDIHRYLPDNRADFLEVCKKTLHAKNRPYHLLSGAWEDKFTSACRIIESLTAKDQVA